MAEIDPEKILAEFEAARAKLHQPEIHEGIDDRLKKIIISTVVIVVVASVALWVLSMLLDEMRPSRTPRPQTPIQDAR